MLEFLKSIARSILKDEIDEHVSIISDYAADIVILTEKNKELFAKIDSLTYTSELEKYYDTKYKTTNIAYNRYDMGKNILIDVRNFIQPNDFNLPIIKGKNDDEIAFNSLKWVKENITYISDKKQYGVDEYWSFPYQVLDSRKDDCESGSVLLASIMIKNGVKPWKVRVTAGNVFDPFANKNMGHAFVVYFSEECNKWVLLDWCFFYNDKPISERKDYKDENFYKDIWFSFSQYKSWGNEVDIRKADSLLNKQEVK